MHTTDKTRETSKAHRIGGNQFDPMAGEPQCRDRLARRQAGALAEKDFGSLRSHLKYRSGAYSIARNEMRMRQDLGKAGQEAARATRALLVSLAPFALSIVAAASFLSWMRHAAPIKDEHHESEG
jgi:hypothetical protein